MIAKAVVEGGVIRPITHEPIELFKQTVKEGEYVEITFRKWANSRTDRQNRYLHALINRYKDALGYSMTEAKNELCIQFGISVKVDNWEDFEPPEWGGHFILYFHELYFRKSTREYKTTEMKTLIDGIRLSMDENHIEYQDIIPEE